MTAEISKVFVYGTLLQGESRNQYLEGCKLIQALEVPGKLYDTGRGYPAALFDEDSKGTVAGELYAINTEVDKKLEELDEVEGTRLRLYRRKDIRHRGRRFYVYEAGEILKGSLGTENRIKSGSWRRHGSVALKNPTEFAINFETQQKQRYREFVPLGSNGLMFLRGEIPVLITAPHAARHVRMGKMKYQEELTGAISVILHALTGSHALYTHWALKIDPNFYENTLFKKKLREIITDHGIRFVLDIHGTRREWKEDIYPGVGNDREFLLGNESYLHELETSAKSNDLSLGSLHIFPASRQSTVTKFVARNLGIPAMQIEINERLRHPETNPSAFKKLVQFLNQYILRSEGVSDLYLYR